MQLDFVTEMELNRKGRTVSCFSISGFSVRQGAQLLNIAEKCNGLKGTEREKIRNS